MNAPAITMQNGDIVTLVGGQVLLNDIPLEPKTPSVLVVMRIGRRLYQLNSDYV